MTTTAAPGTPARPASAGAPVVGTAATQPRPSGFRGAVVLAVLLTVPAAYLVAKGELSAHDALVRFGCAWAFAAGGVALVLSTVGGGPAADPAPDADATEADHAPAAAPGAADPAYADGGAEPPLG